MYRQDFIDNITTWEQLIDFCQDEDCEICDDIYSENERDDKIEENLIDIASCKYWDELRDWLNNIPVGYEYYFQDDCDDWQEADIYIFEDRKEEVIRWMDNGGYWDDDSDEDKETGSIEEDEDLSPVESDVSFGDLFLSCDNELKSIQGAQQKEAEVNNEMFSSLIMSSTITKKN